MSERAPSWVEPVMRTGYTARGIVYILTGILAFLAAWRGGQAEDQSGAMQTLLDEPFGRPMLWAIAIGLFCYAIWRIICSVMDLEDSGTDAKGLIGRSAQMASGLINGALGVSVASIAMGGGSSGDSGKESMVSKLLAMPFGQWLVGIVGLIVIAAGAYHIYKGYKEKYREHLRWTPWLEKLSQPARFGVMAHGVVIVMFGVFFIFAAINADPNQAGGLQQAFEVVRGAAFGRILLGALALGMIGFGLYCWVEATCRILPTRPHDGVQTMAQKLRNKANEATA